LNVGRNLKLSILVIKASMIFETFHIFLNYYYYYYYFSFYFVFEC